MPGLVLGIEPGQPYEELRRPFRPATRSFSTRTASWRLAATASCTARSGWTSCSASKRDLTAQEIAEAVLEDCRRWVGGDLRDDCAIVVVRRL